MFDRTPRLPPPPLLSLIRLVHPDCLTWTNQLGPFAYPFAFPASWKEKKSNTKVRPLKTFLHIGAEAFLVSFIVIT